MWNIQQHGPWHNSMTMRTIKNGITSVEKKQQQQQPRPYIWSAKIKKDVQTHCAILKEELTDRPTKRKKGLKWNPEKTMIQCDLVSLATETATKKVTKCQTRRMFWYARLFTSFIIQCVYWERKRNEDGELQEKDHITNTIYNHIEKIIHIFRWLCDRSFLSRFCVRCVLNETASQPEPNEIENVQKKQNSEVDFMFLYCVHFCCCYLKRWPRRWWQPKYHQPFILSWNLYVEMINICVFFPNAFVCVCASVCHRLFHLSRFLLFPSSFERLVCSGTVLFTFVLLLLLTIPLKVKLAPNEIR